MGRLKVCTTGAVPLTPGIPANISNSFSVSRSAFRPSTASSRPTPLHPLFRPHAAGQTPGRCHRARNGWHQADRPGQVGEPVELGSPAARDQQTGENLYAGNDIDRGHLVRRASAVRGDTQAEAGQANVDTFHYTNAAPQQPSSIRAWPSGSAWSPICWTTQPTTAGASSFSRVRSSARPTPSTAACRSR